MRSTTKGVTFNEIKHSSRDDVGGGVTASTEQLWGWLRTMQTIRSFEDEAVKRHRRGDIVGSTHLCNGQEAVPVGAVSALTDPNDAVFATYRGHGWSLACGVPVDRLFAELMGRAAGINGGRAGSAYNSSADHRFYGENSIVGAGLPLACGAALAGKLDGTERVAVVDFGDGATNQGASHEALNFAAAFDLAVVFVCENNVYSELTPIDAMVGNPLLYERAASYGMPAERVDGNDVEAVFDRVQEAAARAREGGGPTFIEAMTYRIIGHYIGDAEAYRPPGELEERLKEEPIVKLRSKLVASGATDDEVDAAIDEVKSSVAAAAEWASEQPLADPTTVKEHLYA